MAVGVLTSFGAAQASLSKAAGGAKPRPDAAAAAVGVPVVDNASVAKPGVSLGAPSNARATKALSSEVVPALAGYTVVKTEFANPAGSQTLGTAACPGTTVAFGGGVLGNSFSLQQNVNSSYPIVSGGVAKGWGGYVDNASPDDEVFLVYAICAKKPANYAVVSAGFANPHTSQTSGTVQCPIASTGVRMKPFDGGAVGASTGLNQNINTTIPVKSSRSWRVDMNNADVTDSTMTLYVVCGLRSGWKVLQGAAVANGALNQTSAGVVCAAGLTSVGGGLYSSSGSTSVNLNGTYPDSGASWLSYENNATLSSASITPYVVCLS